MGEGVSVGSGVKVVVAVGVSVGVGVFVTVGVAVLVGVKEGLINLSPGMGAAELRIRSFNPGKAIHTTTAELAMIRKRIVISPQVKPLFFFAFFCFGGRGGITAADSSGSSLNSSMKLS